MSEIEWKDMPGDYPAGVGFSFPCHGEYGYPRHHDRCPANDRDHGHLHVYDEGLEGRIPFCCRSQEGVRRLVEHLRRDDGLDEDQADAVPGLEAFKRLPMALTPEEAADLNDPERMKRLTGYLLYGC